MKIKTYAILKNYFPDVIDMVLELKNIEQVKNQLEEINPSAKEILNLSRFAVDDTFVSLNHQLNGNEAISVIPPSSGG